MSWDSEGGGYLVLVNDEEQFSIWPEDTRIPDGWRGEGMRGARTECLDYVQRVWKDMRPRTLREAVGDDGGQAT